MHDKTPNIQKNSKHFLTNLLSFFFTKGKRYLTFELMCFFVVLLSYLLTKIQKLYYNIRKTNIGQIAEKQLYSQLKKHKFVFDNKPRKDIISGYTMIPDATVKINSYCIPIDAKHSLNIIDYNFFPFLYLLDYTFAYKMLNFVLNMHDVQKIRNLINNIVHNMSKRKYHLITYNPINYVLYFPSDQFSFYMKKHMSDLLKKLSKYDIFICSKHNIKEQLLKI